MSSHHTVRDEQEPALVLAELAGVDYEQVGELLEWGPTVLVFVPALAQVLAWGIKADHVLGTVVPQAPELYQAHQLGTQDPFSYAFELLEHTKHQAAHVFVGNHRGFAERYATVFEWLDLVLHEPNTSTSYHRRSFEKWVSAGILLDFWGPQGGVRFKPKQSGMVRRPGPIWVSEYRREQ